MIGTKTQKGITLIALIITIIVLLILAVVAIGAVREDGVIVKAQDAASNYKEAQIEEEINLYAMEYYMNNKRIMKEDTVDEMTQVSKATGVSPERLTVHYNPKDQSEHVLYRIDKVTAEERTILEQNKVKPLRGDADLDGVLTKKDGELISDAEGTGNYEINGKFVLDENGDFKEEFLDLWDFDNDGMITSSDGSLINDIFYGIYIYTGGYAE